MKEVLTTHEVAKICHVTMTTVVNWIEEGALTAYKTKGGHRRVKKDDLIRFLEEHNMPIALKTNILVVDDEESIRKGFKKLLEKEGYSVDSAGNGFEAGITIERNRPSLVIVDLVMPEFDGFWVCKHIRKLEGLKNMKIIAMTGFPSDANIKKAKQSGANICLAKPIDNKVLLKEIRRLIG